MAPGILPLATSFLKNSPTLASFSLLKCAPAGISKVPSALAGVAIASINRAPAKCDTRFETISPPRKSVPRSVAVGPSGTRAAESGHRLRVQGGAVVGKAAENNSADRWRCGQRIHRRRDRDAGRAIGGETIDAGGDGRKGD